MRFVHAGDIHLGAGFRSRPEIGEQLQARHRQAWDELVRYAITQEVDALLIAGDLLDTSDPDRLSWAAESAVVRGLRRLAERDIPVFVAAGNHDPADAKSAYRRIELPENVTLFDATSPRMVTLTPTDPEVVIHGVGFDAPDVRDNLARRFDAARDGKFHIALMHAQVTGVSGSDRHGSYAECSASDLRSRGIHYWALGHIHQPTSVLDEPSGPLVARYSGSLFPLDVSESGVKGCWLVDVDADRHVRASFVPLASVRWEQIRFEVSPDDDVAAVETRIGDQITAINPGGGDLCLRLTLTGRSQLAGDDDRWADLLRAIKNEHRLLHLEVRSELRPAINLDAFADEPHVLGQLITRYRGSADRPERLVQQVLGDDAALLRPVCDDRELTGDALIEYQRDVLERAMDVLTGRLVDAAELPQ